MPQYPRTAYPSPSLKRYVVHTYCYPAAGLIGPIFEVGGCVVIDCVKMVVISTAKIRTKPVIRIVVFNDAAALCFDGGAGGIRPLRLICNGLHRCIYYSRRMNQEYC